MYKATVYKLREKSFLMGYDEHRSSASPTEAVKESYFRGYVRCINIETSKISKFLVVKDMSLPYPHRRVIDVTKTTGFWLSDILV